MRFLTEYSLAGDAPDGWKTGYVLGLFISGFFLLVAFIYWQSIARYPLMPLWVWKDRNFSLVRSLLPDSRIQLTDFSSWEFSYLDLWGFLQ